MEYYENIREDLIELIRKTVETQNIKVAAVAEVGGGEFNTLGQIAEEFSISRDFVTGFDVREPQNLANCYNYFKHDFSKKLETYNGPKSDILICGDVIEHSTDPSIFLRNCDEILNIGGIVVFSVPNVRNFRLILNVIIGGDFPRHNSGLFDRTHFSWFTRKSFEKLVSETVSWFKLSHQYKGRAIPKIYNSGRFLEFLALQNIWVYQKC